jgi:hypothetical protein
VRTVPWLIALIKKQTSPEAQEYAARAIWHLASQDENRTIVVVAGGIKPLIAMLMADGTHARHPTPPSQL